MISKELIYYYIWFFMIYAFLGWCTEVIYATIKTREFSNRGFLNGPLCPIYGFGVVALVMFVNPLKDNLIMLFISSTILVSFLEYVTGFVLEKLFHHKWWDYSNMKFNLNGYISLTFSLLWGVGCVIIIRYLHPFINKLVDIIPNITGHVLVGTLVILLLIDLYMTIISINGLNRRLSRLQEITNNIKSVSDELGVTIYQKTSDVLEKNDKVKLRLANLLEEQRLLLKSRTKSHSRIIRAFPRMRSERFSDALEKLKKDIKEKN